MTPLQRTLSEALLIALLGLLPVWRSTTGWFLDAFAGAWRLDSAAATANAVLPQPVLLCRGPRAGSHRGVAGRCP